MSPLTSEITITGRNGYDISALTSVQSGHSAILLCLHGFGGDKHSTVIAALAEALERDGIGVVTFDWPAHGDSPAADSSLTVENCLRDLDTVLAWIRRRWPMPVSCFATSFGGYLAALYRASHPEAFRKLVLRSPALCMPRTFIDFFPPEERERFLAGAPVTMGYDRTMRLTRTFYDSLLAHDPFHTPIPLPENVMILQGDKDDVVSPEDTAAFAERNRIRVVWFRGTDHRYKAPGDPERIVTETRVFLRGERQTHFPLTIPEDGIPLNAALDLPVQRKARYPLVIVIHGFTGHMEEAHITGISEMLNRIGCATLRVDMYGHGGSGGSFRRHTLYKWLTNAMTVIDFAGSLSFVSELYLCGHSQGGLTVMLAAAMKPERISGIVPMSPAVCIPADARAGTLLGNTFDPERVPDEIRSPDGWVLDGNYIRTARTIHVEDAVEGYRGPVLLVHGAADETIPAAYSADAQKAYADAELTVIPDDTHCYDRHLSEAIDAVRQWMLKRLSPAE